MKALLFLARRLREPSTWAVVTVLLAAFGVPAPVVAVAGSVLDVAPAIIDALAIGGAAAAGVLLPERGADAPAGPFPR